jgi:hypothetical protein
LLLINLIEFRIVLSTLYEFACKNIKISEVKV